MQANVHLQTYEQAAADATPPYWETTILAPGMVSDEVFVEGLPVGSVFSFIWNGMISMSFQLVGFLLTYLLHTTHAAKNGSRAGLGMANHQIRTVTISTLPPSLVALSPPQLHPSWMIPQEGVTVEVAFQALRVANGWRTYL